MNEFEKDIAYVKSVFSKVITPDDLSHAKRLKRHFFDKYVILISPTDKKFIKLREELNQLEVDITKKITSAYLL